MKNVFERANIFYIFSCDCNNKLVYTHAHLYLLDTIINTIIITVQLLLLLIPSQNDKRQLIIEI